MPKDKRDKSSLRELGHEFQELTVHEYQYHAEPVRPCVNEECQGRIKKHDSLKFYHDIYYD